MPNLRGLYSGFTAGEFSPKMLGQVDFAQYSYGCEILENFIVWPQGMISSRPGTRYVAAGKEPTTPIRLIPFEFSTVQAYIVEMGHLYFRFFMNQGQILSSGTPYTVVHTYKSTDLFDINYCQSADILFLAHPDYAPKALSRTGHTSWTISDITFVDGPYLPVNTTATTLTASGTTGTVTLTASAAVFWDGHVGAFFKLGATGYCKITALTSNTEATAEVIVTLATAGPTTTWQEGAWSGYRGFPSVVGFFENRLWWGATTHQPSTLWASASGDYYNHTPGSDDNDPIAVTLNSDAVNSIKWINGTKVLMVGTSRGQWHISSTGTNEAITPSNIKAVQETGLTSSNIALRSDHTILFWQEFGRNLMEIAYSLETDSYMATPLTVMAEHIGRSPIKEMAFLQEPLGSLWCVREDGQMAVLTYERQHKVVAWSRLVTDGYYESVARIPGVGRDEVWVLVKRTINGATVRYIELFQDLETYENDSEDLFYVDCGLTYDSTPTTTIAGLTHLEGEEVAILGDGSVLPSETVVSGAITLDRSASVVQVGLPYTATVKPVRPELKYQGGTLQNRRQRIFLEGIRFYKSYAGKIGESLDKLDIIPFKSMGEAMDEPLTLYTGDKRPQVPGSYNRDGQVYIVQDLPLPMNILALFPRLDVQGANG